MHTYLAYLRDRLIVAKDLLTDRKYLVQISDENVHRVRSIMDEVFGHENFVALIPFQTTGLQSRYIKGVYDFLIWYSKKKETQ